MIRDTTGVQFILSPRPGETLRSFLLRLIKYRQSPKPWIWASSAEEMPYWQYCGWQNGFGWASSTLRVYSHKLGWHWDCGKEEWVAFVPSAGSALVKPENQGPGPWGLNKREHRILMARYGENHQSVADIALTENVTRSRIYQIEKKALCKLRFRTRERARAQFYYVDADELPETLRNILLAPRA